MAKKEAQAQMTNVADFFSGKSIFQIRLDEERGQLLFLLYDKNDSTRRAMVIPTFGELEALREGIRIWKETRGWEKFDEFDKFWDYLTQGRGSLVHTYEKDGKEITKRFGFVVLRADDKRRYNNLGFTLRVDVDGKEENRFVFPLSPVQMYQMEFIINKYKRLVNEAEIRRRAEKLARYLQERAERREEDVDERSIERAQPEATFDSEEQSYERKTGVQQKASKGTVKKYTRRTYVKR